MSSSNALFTMRAFTREDDVILLKSGEVLFRPGETGTTMFGLLEGAIRITWIGQAGQNGHEDIPVGHVFGAGALVMEGHKRLGMATATTDCRLIEMTREKFFLPSMKPRCLPSSCWHRSMNACGISKWPINNGYQNQLTPTIGSESL